MRILHHGPEHCFLYHLISSVYFVMISMTGVYSRIHQWNRYVIQLNLHLAVTLGEWLSDRLTEGDRLIQVKTIETVCGDLVKGEHYRLIEVTA